MQHDRIRQFAVVVSVLIMIGMNYLSNVGVFGGQTNRAVSDKYHTLITPASYAFAIWGLIFLGLLAFAVYQASKAQRTNPRFRAIGWWVVLNTLCNAIWSPLFNNEQIGMALLVILVMLFSLAVIEQRLLEWQHQPFVPTDPDATLIESKASAAEMWLARIPFSIYFGWVTVATILTITVYLKSTDFSLLDLPEQTWAVAILIVGLVVGAIIFNRYRSVAYILVFAWAYTAIAVEQHGIGQIPVVTGAGAGVAVGLAVLGIIRAQKAPVYS